MRFFEYESRAIVAKAGIPVTRHGFAKSADEARTIARDSYSKKRIGGGGGYTNAASRPCQPSRLVLCKTGCQPNL